MSHEQLTVGHLRRLLADSSIDDDTPVCITAAKPLTATPEDGCAAVARRAWVQASDAVPIDLGGTDPEFESTRGVLIITDEPGPPFTVPCAHCNLMLAPSIPGPWFHADGHRYSHPAEPVTGSQPWWERWERLAGEQRDAVYRAWAARHPWQDDDGYDWLAQIEVSDPCTWNPDSPLAILLRMAAAGDLHPLAAALAAALEPGRSPGDTAG